MAQAVSPMVKLALIVEYDGTRYYGFQIQDRLPTIQEEIEKAIYKIAGERIRIAYASRTDAGVHARGQVVAFRTRSSLSPFTWVKALNYYLPQDIAVREAWPVSEDFDARRAAVSREYRYLITNRPTRSPLEGGYAYHVTHPLDVEAMRRACQVLVGEHDFAPFAGPVEGKASNTVRTLYRAEISRHGDIVQLDMEANSFLPQQVRRTVGALVRVGTGKMGVEAFWEMAQSKVRGIVGPNAPPHGLCLTRVNYTNLGEV